jgi:malate dehydrogenase
LPHNLRSNAEKTGKGKEKRMKITILGAAGTLGSCTAFNIISHKLADELVLIDPWENMLKAHWMDLSTAATGQDITLRLGSYEQMRGSDIVVMAAGAPSDTISSRNELLPGNLPIVKENAAQIKQHCPDAIVITATNPVDPLNYAMYLLDSNRERRRFIGYSLNDTFRFRKMSALALGVKPARVSGMVIGEHDASQVMLFSTLRLDGKPVESDEEFRNKIKQQASFTLQSLESLKPRRTSGWTTAVGIASVIQAITDNTGEMLPCSAVFDGEYGYHRLSMGAPAIIGREGVRKIIELELDQDEEEALENSARTVEPYMRFVEDGLGKA